MKLLRKAMTLAKTATLDFAFLKDFSLLNFLIKHKTLKPPPFFGGGCFYLICFT